VTDSVFQLCAGSSLTRVIKQDYTWFFQLGNGASFATEMPWRLVAADGLRVSSEDEGQTFGLAQPVDAAESVLGCVGAAPIKSLHAEPLTGDLHVEFANGMRLELLQLSSGHESWRLLAGGKEVVCLGGGSLTSF
jgi:hypothetical protein